MIKVNIKKINSKICVCVWVSVCSVAQLWPKDYSPLGSSVHWICQAKILEWVVFSHSRGSSQPRDPTHASFVSCTGRQVLYHKRHLRSPTIWEDAMERTENNFCAAAAAAAAKSRQLCLTLCDPIDGSPPGSRPWDSPGKKTGVGCHFLLQCMKVKSESEVAQSCPTLCNPMDCSLPGSSIHGIFQARVLELGAIALSELMCYFCQNCKT